MERYRRSNARNINKEDKTDYKVKIARQSIICGVIVLIVSVISVLKSETAENLSGKIGDALSYTVDYKNAVADIVDKISDFTKGE